MRDAVGKGAGNVETFKAGELEEGHGTAKGED